jgi:carbonic anhydrase
MTTHEPIDMNKKKSEALIVHCSDPRFQEAYRKITDNLGDYYDLIVLPGASKAVIDNNEVIDNINLLHEFHNFEKVYLMDHIDCGAYGKVGNEKEAHAKCLKKATDIIKRKLPSLEVVSYLVGSKGSEII